MKWKLLLLIIIIIVAVIIYLIYNNYKPSISSFYIDNISPVYNIPWDAIPELHDHINPLLENIMENLPKGDLYKLHDQMPEYKMRFDDADKILKSRDYYTKVEMNLRDHTGNGSSRLVLTNNANNQLSDGKYQLSDGKYRLNSSLKFSKLTGFFYYPPGGFKEWHTNQNSGRVPNWRIYLIFLTNPDTESYFSYINPKTKKFHRMRDKHMHFNVFYLNNNPNRLLWHSVKCIKGGRISIGLNINPFTIPSLAKILENLDFLS